MKYCFSIAALFSIVLADPGFVKLPVSVKKPNTSHVSPSLGRRSEDFPVRMKDDFVAYYVDVSLGTPGQTEQVQIDTGSSDLWVYGPQSSGADQIYDPSQSSSSKFVDNNFNIQYVDNSGAEGSYYTDDATLGGVTVDLQFGVATNSYEGSAVFGIATSDNEAGDSYPNYPVVLKQQGHIESTAYSLYLDDVNAASGSLLFGGVDTGKYSGQLYTVPITSDQGFNVDFTIEGHQLNGVLDSGTSFTYLPDDIANSLGAKVGGTWNANQGLFYVDKATDLSLTFSFSGAEVTVPSSELFSEYGGGLALLVSRASETGGDLILGDSFLRSAYVVYDLDNNQIAIAQANYGGSGSIELITGAGIPGAQPAPEL